MGDFLTILRILFLKSMSERVGSDNHSKHKMAWEISDKKSNKKCEFGINFA